MTHCRENALKEVSKLLGVDFTPLFSAEHENQRLVDTCIQMVRWLSPCQRTSCTCGYSCQQSVFWACMQLAPGIPTTAAPRLLLAQAARAIESPDAMKRGETKQRTIDVQVLAVVKHDKLVGCHDLCLCLQI